MKKLISQGAGIAALSVVFFAGSLLAKPGMAFGYGYGSEETPKETTETPKEVSKDTKEKRSGKEYRKYREYREKYAPQRAVYLKLRAYKRSADPMLVREFANRKAAYEVYQGHSLAELRNARINDATLMRYLEYKQYKGYKKYKELKRDLHLN